MSTRTNLLNNPSGRRTTTGYTVAGGTIGQDALTDTYVLSTGTPTAGNLNITLESMVIGAGKLNGITQYTYSATIYGSNVTTKLLASGTGVTTASSTTVTAGTYTRVSVTFTTNASGTVTFQIVNTTSGAVGSVVGFRDALVEIGSVLGTYLDGTYQFAVWTGSADSSPSILYAPVLTLTPYVDQNPGIRVQISITDLPPSAQTVNITRSVEGRTMKVRGGVNLFAIGGAQVMDFETPIGATATYRAELIDINGLSLGFANTSSNTLPATSIPGSAYAVIHQPLKPVLNVIAPLDAETSDVVINPIPGGLFYPEGAAVGTWVGGRRQGIQGMKLTIQAMSFADADEFRSMFGDYSSDFPSVICVRTIPPVRLPRVLFASVSELHESVDYVNSRVIFQLIVDEVAPPSPGLIIPVLRREDIDAAFTTRAARAAGYATRIQRDADYSKAGLAGP